MYEPEGGADPARLVLARYDAATDSFSGDRTSELWDAVALARQRGERGQGRRVAVVDTGFDLSIPALAAQHLVWPQRASAPTAHGSVVALLIREVAPDVTLDLYPVGDGDHVDEALLLRAVTQAGTSDADLINLSLGEKRPVAGAVELARVVGDLEPWPDLSDADVPFFLGEAMRQHASWRTWLRPQAHTAVESAVLAAVEHDKVVVAACGNDAGSVFTPALLPGVFAVSFLKAVRVASESGTERASPEAPFGYSQSLVSDFGLEQPELTLGSSFATPLVTGFAATLPDLRTLGAHRDALRLVSNGDDLRWRIDPSSPGWERRWSVVNRSFLDAVDASPHRHWELADDDRVPCPECSLFAAQPYVDGGLFWLLTGRLDRAERTLRAATRFAPQNPHAAADLGMVHAVRAALARDTGDLASAATHLREAAARFVVASGLRPEDEVLRRRAEEFAGAEAEPGAWTWRPELEPAPASDPPVPTT